MSTEQESQRDLPLDAAAADEVVGGRSVKRQTKKTGHHLASPKPNPPAPAPVVAPPLGLGMGPDPDYPNPDTDTGDPTA
jgi:hypothetical protein